MTLFEDLESFGFILALQDQAVNAFWTLVQHSIQDRVDLVESSALCK